VGLIGSQKPLENKPKVSWMVGMKSYIKACVFFVLCLTMIGCTQIEMQETATITPSPVIVATATTNFELPTFALPTLSGHGALPTIAFNTPAVGTPTPYSTPDISKFELPYFESTVIPGLLQSNLTTETLTNFEGYNVKRISGWRYGFNGLVWMDANHLLLYPTAGIYSIGGGWHPGIFPAVANLDSGTFWIPLPSWRGANYQPALPRWSSQLGVLIAAASDNSVGIYSPDGTVQKIYEGEFLGVSPSATKLLIDDTWIDLSSGKTVQFAWQQTEIAENYPGMYSLRPIWSPDETRVYTCCYRYGDATTGESLAIPYYAITLDGENTEYPFEALFGTWVMNDKYLLPIWGGVWDGRYSDVYLFDPAAKTYRNLSVLAGISYEWNGADPYCNRPSAQDGGQYVWVDCKDGGHLIDLATFQSRSYPPPADGPYGGGNYTTLDLKWSPDGSFAWFTQDGVENVISGATGKVKSLPKDCSGIGWHLEDNVLLFSCNSGENLSLLDAQTGSILKQAILPDDLSAMRWSQDGKHYDLMSRDDNSLWQLDYPDLDNLKQVTPAMPELKQIISNPNLAESPIQEIVWSPDNSAVAFISAQDIFVVQIENKP
jgi:hypothetical protein